MNAEENEPRWEPARLIPVSGIGSADEQERRATSALLAVLSAVQEFGSAFTKPYGAPKSKLETFTEVTFEMQDGKNVRPDGLIRCSRGQKKWMALVEVKTGNNPLNKQQIENYLDVAKEQGFNCVITISNQISMIPGQHPVTVDKRKIKKVDLYHLSWSRILTEAVLQKSHRGVADPDQAWILDELIRYLEYPKTGAMDFSDMGQNWVAVRDAVKNGTLRHTDKHATEIAGKWEELVSFAALRLSRKLGASVQEILTAKERADIGIRITNIVDDMVTKGMMSAKIRIPDAVGDIVLKSDLRTQQIFASVNVNAPKSSRTLTRITWLLRQLKETSPRVRIDSWGVRSRTSMSDLLGNVRQKPELLIPIDGKELASFTVSCIKPMGVKRSAGKNSFIDSVLDTFDNFYGDVVQHLHEWQAPAPKMKEPPIRKEEVFVDVSMQEVPSSAPNVGNSPVSLSSEETQSDSSSPFT